VSDHPNDKQELKPTVQSVDTAVRDADVVLADSGYFSEEAMGFRQFHLRGKPKVELEKN
jgi:hypothetical protein